MFGDRLKPVERKLGGVMSETIAELNLLSSIPWSDAKGGKPVFEAINGKKKFSITVKNEQAIAWEKVFKQNINADSLAAKEFELEGDQELTIAIIENAVKVILILALTGLLAYALARGYRVSGKKTRTTWQFDLSPKQE